MTSDDPRPRRSYARVEIAARDGGFAVLLDGRPVRTPARRFLIASTRALAELVAEEWAAQAERIELSTMTATRLLNVALDRAPDTRAALADEVARFAETDLVCHLAEEPELAQREEAAWAPLRVWAEEALGQALTAAPGVRAHPQPAASLTAARERALALDDVRLVALAHATALLGSGVLALALLEGRLDAAAAFAASRIDETYQEERWGVDAEAAARTERLAAELAVVERMILAVE
jgi:chaperone required for assembly of F1-ATPase